MMVAVDLRPDNLDRVVQGLRLLVRERQHTERQSCQELLDTLNGLLEIELALKERQNVLGED